MAASACEDTPYLCGLENLPTRVFVDTFVGRFDYMWGEYGLVIRDKFGADDTAWISADYCAVVPNDE